MKHNRHFIKVIIFILAILIIPVNFTSAATGLKIKYNNKDVNYTGKKVTYKLGSSTLNNKHYPGVIIDGTSLVSAYDVFQNSPLKMKYTYKGSTKKITIQKDYKIVEMTVGSKTAYIDGVKTNISVAPLLVTYSAMKKEKVLVPARFVAEAFGYSYQYNSSTGVATLKESNVKPLNIYYDEKWHTYYGSQDKVKVQGNSIDLATLPAITLNNVHLSQVYKVFAQSSIGAKYKYNEAEQTVSIVKDDIIIELTLGNTTAVVNGKKEKMKEYPRLIKNKSNSKSYVLADTQFIAQKLGYSYKWDEGSKTSIITAPVIPKPDNPAPPDNPNPVQPQEPSLLLNLNLLPNMKEISDNILASKTTNISSEFAPINPALTSVYKDTNVYTDRTVYKVETTMPFGNITSAIENDILLINLESVVSEIKTYNFIDGVINNISTSYDGQSNMTTLSIDGLTSTNYNLQVLDGGRILEISIYNNILNSINIVKRNGYDIITMDTGMNQKPILREDDQNIYLDFSNTINGIGLYEGILSGDYINNLYVDSNGSTTQIKINKTTSDYFITQDGNVCMLTIGTVPTTNDIQIILPDGMSREEVTDVDLYYNKQFKITIPGNHKAFYEANPIRTDNPAISSIQVSINSYNDTEIIFKTKSIQGYKIEDTSNYLNVIVDIPKNIYSNIVVFDAGHGGSDPGAMYGGYKEKDLNYEIIYSCMQEYFNQEDSNIKMYWTRSTDTFITLSDRAQYAKKMGADLFVSLHMNAASSNASGTEIYYSNSNKSVNYSGLTSKTMASAYQSKLIKDLGMTNRGIKQNDLYVCKNNSVPAILIELGFMTNSSDLKKLSNSTFQQNAAKSIFEATQDIFERYPTGR